MTPRAKDQQVQIFQNDKSKRILIGSITACGLGHTMTASSYAIFAELGYVPGEIWQCIERLWRLGQDHGVLVDFLSFLNSLDERMLKIIYEKQKTLDLFDTDFTLDWIKELCA